MTGVQRANPVIDGDLALLKKTGESANKAVDDTLLAHLSHREVEYWL